MTYIDCLNGWIFVCISWMKAMRVPGISHLIFAKRNKSDLLHKHERGFTMMNILILFFKLSKKKKIKKNPELFSFKNVFIILPTE